MAIALVLPLRPEDYAGLLISEVDFPQHLLRFGTRFGGRDFNKGRQSFVTPFPTALAALLRACAGGRVDGPLLLRRAVWEGRSKPRLSVDSPEDVVTHFDRALSSARPDEVQTPQDGKLLFRRVLRDMGGVTEDSLAKEFKPLLSQVSLASNVRFYDLRASCNSEMQYSGVSHLVQRYVTGHTTNDILFEYVSLDPTVSEMQKYFVHIQPLLTAIEERAQELGIA